jgi:transposase-like protein
MALMDALQQADDGNFLRSLAETVLQILMEADRDGLIGAGRYERSGERATWRNGYRDRSLDTRLGQLNLRFPHHRQRPRRANLPVRCARLRGPRPRPALGRAIVRH